MLEQKNEPAFPNSNGYITGMDLRDYFAGQVLAGIAADCLELGYQEDADPQVVAIGAAKVAYTYAEAMLAERSKAGGDDNA